MVSWSSRRQIAYIGGVLGVVIFLIALPTFFVVYEAPSCTDGVKNQDELGVDCGGPCSVLCKAEALDLITRWQRVFKVKEGIYNVLAYVENPNLESGVENISYRFKVYDAENLLLYERTGKTFVPPRKVFAIFETNINTGTRVPARALFEFLGSPSWSKNFSSEPSLVITNKVLSKEEGLPRLTASLENRTDDRIDNVEVVAILYNSVENAIASSRTIVDSVNKGGSASLVFTWPEAFSEEATRIELIYRVMR